MALVRENTPRSDTPLAQHTSRRQMLRLMVATGLTVSGGAVLSSCGQTSSTNPKVDLTSTGWPIDAMPAKADQDKDPKLKAYAGVLDEWMKKNPGVSIKKITLDVWNPQALTSAITAGTAPSWYPTITVGSFQDLTIRTAMAKGMMADVTELNERYQVKEKLAKYTVPYYDAWKTGGKYYTIPYDYIAGGWVTYYRRDLFEQAGIPEPKDDWTWDDLKSISATLTKDKVKGLSFTNWGIYWLHQSGGWDFLTRTPSPTTAWHWKYDYTTHSDRWLKAVDTFRTMNTGDKSMIVDSTKSDNLPPFRNGDAAIVFLNTGFFTRLPTTPESFDPLAQKYGKTQDELIGMLPMPRFSDGSFGATQGSLSCNSLYPRLSKSSLEKAYDLYMLVVAGEGYAKIRSAAYADTKDLRYVYADSLPAFEYGSIPGVTGTMEDAWGKRWYASLQKILELPALPNPGAYFPPERNNGPTNDAESDANSGWMFTDKSPREILDKMQNTRAQQVQSLSSSLSADQFKEAARRYFGDLDTFWKQHAPEFHSTVFQPWYQQKVQPAIK